MIKLVVDVGLPPAWVDVFAKHGWPAVHWSDVGDPIGYLMAVIADEAQVWLSGRKYWPGLLRIRAPRS